MIVENQWLLVLRVVLGFAGVVLILKIVFFFGDYQERKFLKGKKKALEDYEESVANYLKNRGDHEALEVCRRKGDIYFSFRIPDTFPLPILDFEEDAPFVDNRVLREQLVNEDIEKRLVEKDDQRSA